MADQILMPKATAVWLVDNTSLTFEQIADFCGLHRLEVRGIADGEVARDIRGADPIANGQLNREELDAAEKNGGYRMKAQKSRHAELLKPVKKGPRYTPLSRRHDRPNAVLWLIRNHAELKDSQIMRLVGTTKPTIQQIRERSHWNSANLQPQDPVTLGLCSQVDLDAEVKKSAKRVDKTAGAEDDGGTLLSANDTTGYEPGGSTPPEEIDKGPTPGELKQEEARMLANLKGISDVKPDDAGDDEEEATDKP